MTGIGERVGVIREAISLIVMVIGVAILFRGLNGGKAGRKGLLRPSAGTYGRAEGWRITVVGLTVSTLGLGGLLGLRWVIFIAIGFGIVECIEASAVLAAWHHGDVTKARSRRFTVK